MYQPEPILEVASRRGYLASAGVVAESDRLRRRFASPALSCTAGAVLSLLVGPGWVLPAVFGMGAAVLLVVWVSPSASRQAALDRMVELEPFAVAGASPSVRRAAVRRSAYLRSIRHRRRLAARVLAATGGCGGSVGVTPPGAVALSRDPVLGEQIVACLVVDCDDPRLAIAVARLLGASSGVDEHLQRVCDLLAASA